MQRLKKALHISLFAVSTYMSVMMFIIIGNSLMTKVALGLLALIFELTKLTDLHRLQSKKVIYIISYSLKAFLSIIASVGLVLTLLSTQGDVTDTARDVHDAYLLSYDAEIEYWEKEIEQLDETVILLNENLSRNPAGYGLASKSFISQIEAVQELKEEYRLMYASAIQSRLVALSEASMEKSNVDANDMFVEIGSVTGISPQTLKMWVFSLIMILVEISLALTGIDSPESKGRAQTQKNESQAASFEKGATSKEKVIVEIVRRQARQEKSNAKLMTQTELADVMKISRSTVNNVIRRHIKPLMEMNEFSTYGEVYSHLKKAN